MIADCGSVGAGRAVPRTPGELQSRALHQPPSWLWAVVPPPVLKGLGGTPRAAPDPQKAAFGQRRAAPPTPRPVAAQPSRLANPPVHRTSSPAVMSSASTSGSDSSHASASREPIANAAVAQQSAQVRRGDHRDGHKIRHRGAARARVDDMRAPLRRPGRRHRQLVRPGRRHHRRQPARPQGIGHPDPPRPLRPGHAQQLHVPTAVDADSAHSRRRDQPGRALGGPALHDAGRVEPPW